MPCPCVNHVRCVSARAGGRGDGPLSQGFGAAGPSAWFLIVPALVGRCSGCHRPPKHGALSPIGEGFAAGSWPWQFTCTLAAILGLLVWLGALDLISRGLSASEAVARPFDHVQLLSALTAPCWQPWQGQRLAIVVVMRAPSAGIGLPFCAD